MQTTQRGSKFVWLLVVLALFFVLYLAVLFLLIDCSNSPQNNEALNALRSELRGQAEKSRELQIQGERYQKRIEELEGRLYALNALPSPEELAPDNEESTVTSTEATSSSSSGMPTLHASSNSQPTVVFL